jgi:sterol desaturase/sphingolipid hydroxylase (fatty acid hydroxylase superfamily)
MPQIKTWNQLVLLIGLRYFIIAGIAYLIWYIIRRRKIAFKKIQLRLPANKDYQREIFYSILSIFIFSSVPYFLLKSSVRQYTLFYDEIDKYGMLWFWFAFPVMLLVHDAYFYFTHRLMHHPKLFKWFHLIHHKSTNPSPWAAFAFHPLEAVIEVGIVVLFLFIMPICNLHLFFFFFIMMVYNVYGHLGWELYPKGFSTSKIGKWINTSVNHNQHHQYFKGNYGLYFLWWDRWFKTIREDYDIKFDEVKSRTDNLKKV